MDTNNAQYVRAVVNNSMQGKQIEDIQSQRDERSLERLTGNNIVTEGQPQYNNKIIINQ
jgi:hypothetical protein